MRELEEFGESVRRLYVALTRARERCVVAWTRIEGRGNKELPALAWLLHRNRRHEELLGELTGESPAEDGPARTSRHSGRASKYPGRFPQHEPRGLSRRYRCCRCQMPARHRNSRTGRQGSRVRINARGGAQNQPRLPRVQPPDTASPPDDQFYRSFDGSCLGNPGAAAHRTRRAGPRRRRGRPCRSAGTAPSRGAAAGTQRFHFPPRHHGGQLPARDFRVPGMRPRNGKLRKSARPNSRATTSTRNGTKSPER